MLKDRKHKSIVIIVLCILSMVVLSVYFRPLLVSENHQRLLDRGPVTVRLHHFMPVVSKDGQEGKDVPVDLILGKECAIKVARLLSVPVDRYAHLKRKGTVADFQLTIYFEDGTWETFSIAHASIALGGVTASVPFDTKPLLELLLSYCADNPAWYNDLEKWNNNGQVGNRSIK